MMTLAELRQRVERAATHVQAAVATEARAASLHAEARAKRLATERLRVRTGRLRGSIRGSSEAEGDGAILVRLRAGGDPSLPYAAIQEFGGTIRARKRFLAIPTGAAKTAAGVSRYASPRDVAGLRFVPLRGGSRGMLVRETGGRQEVMYWLVPSVTIRGKRYLGDAMDQTAVGLGERLAARVAAALEATP